MNSPRTVPELEREIEELKRNARVAIESGERVIEILRAEKKELEQQLAALSAA